MWIKIADALRELIAVRRGMYVAAIVGFTFGLGERTIASFRDGWSAETMGLLTCAALFGLFVVMNPPLESEK